MVTIYTTDSCPWCVKTKEYLKSKNITYQEFNVAEDMEARETMVSKSKQMGVPVLDINDTIIIGFDREAIDKALNK